MAREIVPPKTKTPGTEVSGVLMAMNPQVPWTIDRPIQPSDTSPGCPVLRVFQLGRRWSFGLPRFPHLSAALAAKLRVAPALCISSSAFDVASGRPNSTSSGLPTVGFRVSPDFDLPASLGAQSPGFPGCCTLWPASGWVSGLPRSLCPSATPSSGSPGFPESRTLWRYRFCVFGALRILRLRLGR